MFLAICRRRQMEALGYIDEDEWPTESALEDYSPRHPEEFNYYRPIDWYVELNLWLRDYRISERQKRTRDKKQQQSEKKPINQFFSK